MKIQTHVRGIVSVLAFCATMAGGAHAADSSSTPILRIETGYHQSGSISSAFNKNGTMALTIGHNEGRLWATPGWEPLRVLRPFIDTSTRKLNACALHPDGSVAVIGDRVDSGAGEDEDEDEKKEKQNASIYFFDTQTGRETLRMERPGVCYIHDLAFSPDGRYLAAVLGSISGSGGLAIINAETRKEMAFVAAEGFSDPGWVRWFPDGRLLAGSSFKMEVYEMAEESGLQGKAGRVSLTRLQTKKFPEVLTAVTISPDGSRIAHSSSHHLGNDVREHKLALFAADLTPVSVADTQGMEFFIYHGWDAKGDLMAWGRNYEGKKPFVRIWKTPAADAYQDVPVIGKSTFAALHALPGRQFLYADGSEMGVLKIEKGGRGELGRLTELGRKVTKETDIASQIPLSRDGTEIGFSYSSEKDFATFSLSTRVLNKLPGSGYPEHLAAATKEGLNDVDSLDKHTSVAYLEDKAAKLLGTESGLPDRSFLLMGTTFGLSAYDSQGTEIWRKSMPFWPLAVNLSADRQLAVAVWSDGIIRWHHLDTGEELLAFFAHADQKRWVLWTKEGYYDCSAGAEDMIGWHVNRGKDREADFFPVSKFRAQFYRPDVISQVLETRDVAAAVKAADEAAGRKATETSVAEVVARMQPPVVELAVGGARGEAEVTGDTFALRYRVRSATAEPVTRLRVLIDGRPITAELPIPANAESETSATVAVPARDCVLSLLAENRFAMSEPVTLRLTRAGAPAPSSTLPLADDVPTALKPKLYLLSVGVNDYEKNDHLPDLRYAAKDATDFSTVFQKQEGGLYQKVEAKLLTDATATADDVLDGLDWIRKQTTAKDVAVVFFAGHGENDEELRYYFCPSDYDPEKRLRTGVPMEAIQKTLASIPGKVLFFIDTCHAGNALGKLFATRGGGSGVDVNRLVNELSSAENGAIVFASSTGRQQSIESEEWQNGAFTKALVEGLEGKADLLRNGKISVATLESWVAERVKELSEGAQTPTVAKPQTVPDFPIAVKR